MNSVMPRTCAPGSPRWLAALALLWCAPILAEPPATAPALAPWPSDPAGLVFRFQTNAFHDDPLAIDDKGRQIPSYQIYQYCRRRAHVDRNWTLLTRGGSFIAQDASQSIVARCKKAGALTIQVMIAPAPEAAGGSGQIISLATDAKLSDFVLMQIKNLLALKLRTSAAGDSLQYFKLATLPDDKPHQLIVSCGAGFVCAYLDGQKSSSAPLPGDFSNWQDGQLIIGDNWQQTQNWPGTIEGIALFTRPISAEQAKADDDAYLQHYATRAPAHVIVVKAKLLARTESPAPQAIGTYRRILAGFEYQVQEVVSGKLDDRKIRVLHWTIMDRVPQPVGQRAIGQCYTLTLESADENPWTDFEYTFDDFQSDVDVPRFIDVAP